LHGGGPADLRELCFDLAAWMFHLGGASKTVADGKRLAEQIIASGKAFDRFRQMVELQGGDISVIDDPARLPSADHRTEVASSQAGYVTAIACEQVGTACVILGGGRERKEDSVDPAVGIEVHKKIGDKVSAGESLCTIHCHSNAQGARARTLLEESYQIASAPPTHKTSLIHRVIYHGEY
jgi:pyrimidine-nucleoside phosphorylase